MVFITFKATYPNNRIRELRKSKHLTQAELANKMGVGSSIMRNYENGYRNPSAETWEKLSGFFDVPVPYVQGVIDEESIPYRLFYEGTEQNNVKNPNKELKTRLRLFSSTLDYSSTETQKRLLAIIDALNDYVSVVNHEYSKVKDREAILGYLADLNTFLRQGMHLVATKQYTKLDKLGDAVSTEFNSKDGKTSKNS